jgi:hypothetical protein
MRTWEISVEVILARNVYYFVELEFKPTEIFGMRYDSQDIPLALR